MFRFRGDVVIYDVSHVAWNQTKKQFATLELRAEKVTQRSENRVCVYKLDEFANGFPTKEELSEELHWEDANEEDTAAQKFIQFSIEQSTADRKSQKSRYETLSASVEIVIDAHFPKYRQSLVMQEQSENYVELITKHCYPLALLPKDARIMSNSDALVSAWSVKNVQYKLCALTNSKFFVQSQQIEQAL